MSWLWIYITMMEWVGTVLVVNAFGDARHRFDFKKTLVYLIANVLFYAIYWCFSLPSYCSFIGYFLLFGYIYWIYREKFIRCFAILVISLMIIGVIELLLTQSLFYICPVDMKYGVLESISATLLLIVSIILRKTKIYKIMGILDRWEPSYAFVAILSLMVFTPVIALRIFKELVVSEYIYITICVLVMWMLVSRIQKTKIENRIRKKYLDSFTDIIAQIRRRQHKVKNQFNTAFGLYRLYDTYDELVEKQKEYLGRLWDYELPTDAIVLEDPIVVALLYEKINEAIEAGIEVETVFSCSMLKRNVTDVIWVEILGTLLDNAIEALSGYDGNRKLWIEIGENCDDCGQISICITNTYRKLKQVEMEKFFELGYSTKGMGRGVGLYDVKQLVYKNKGFLVADNTKREEIDCFQIRIIL